jgi:hypothetical protein
MSGGAYIETSHRFSRRTRRLAWGSCIGLFIAGVIAVVVVFTGDTAGPAAPVAAPSASVGKPAKQSPAAPRSVKLDPAANRVLGRFVLTAVARKNLREAYGLVGPGIKQGMPLKQWLTGAIPVVPFPVTTLQSARFKIDFSRPNHALVEVAMVPTLKSKVKAQIFFADIVKLHGKWVVDSWVPRGSALMPNQQNNG